MLNSFINIKNHLKSIFLKIYLRKCNFVTIEQKGKDHIVVLEVRGKCNISCLFCNYLNDHDSNENKDYLRKLFYQIEKIAKFINKISIGIYHYEPTTFPYLNEVVKFAQKKGIKQMHLVSNGVSISDYKYLKSLKDSGLTSIGLSIFEYNKKFSQVICQSSNVLESKIETLKNCNQLNIPYEINILLMRTNYIKLDSIVKNYHKHIDHKNFIWSLRSISPDMQARNELFLPPLTGVLEEIKKCSLKWKNYTFAVENIPYCLQKRAELNNSNIIFSNNTKGVFAQFCKKCGDKSKCCGFYEEYLGIYGTEEIESNKIIHNPHSINDLQKTFQKLIQAKSLDSNLLPKEQIKLMNEVKRIILPKINHKVINGYVFEKIDYYKNNDSIILSFKKRKSKIHLLFSKNIEYYYMKKSDFCIQFVGQELTEKDKRFFDELYEII